MTILVFGMTFRQILVYKAMLYYVVFSSGSTITAEIQGVIDACVKLTGMPDLTLSFMVSSQTFFYTFFKPLVDSEQARS